MPEHNPRPSAPPEQTRASIRRLSNTTRRALKDGHDAPAVVLHLQLSQELDRLEQDQLRRAA